jgi:hypothetical protein
MPATPPLVASRPRVIRLLATSALAGIAGGSWAALIAHALGVSAALAGGVAGITMAVAVAVVVARRGRAP